MANEIGRYFEYGSALAGTTARCYSHNVAPYLYTAKQGDRITRVRMWARGGFATQGTPRIGLRRVGGGAQDNKVIYTVDMGPLVYGSGPSEHSIAVDWPLLDGATYALFFTDSNTNSGIYYYVIAEQGDTSIDDVQTVDLANLITVGDTYVDLITGYSSDFVFSLAGDVTPDVTIKDIMAGITPDEDYLYADQTWAPSTFEWVTCVPPEGGDARQWVVQHTGMVTAAAVKMYSINAGGNSKLLVTDSAGNIVAKTASTAVPAEGYPKWWIIPLETAISVKKGETYTIWYCTETGSGPYVAANSAIGYRMTQDLSGTYALPPNPLSLTYSAPAGNNYGMAFRLYGVADPGAGTGPGIVSKPSIPSLPEWVESPLDGGFSIASNTSSRYLSFSVPASPNLRDFAMGFFWRIHSTYDTQWPCLIRFATSYVYEYKLPTGSAGTASLYFNGDNALINIGASEYDTNDLFYTFVSHVPNRTNHHLWNLTKGWYKSNTHGFRGITLNPTSIAIGNAVSYNRAPGMVSNFKMWYSQDGRSSKDWAEQEMRSFEPVQQHNLVAWFPLDKNYGLNSGLPTCAPLTEGGSGTYNFTGYPFPFMLQRDLGFRYPITRPPFRRMMPVSNIGVPQDTKPDGADLEIDWSHPLAQGLSSALVFEHGKGVVRDAAKGQPLAATVDAILDANSGGLVYNDFGKAGQTKTNATWNGYGVTWTPGSGPAVKAAVSGEGFSIFFVGKVNNALGTRASILTGDSQNSCFNITPSTREVWWRASATTMFTHSKPLPTFPCYAKIGGAYKRNFYASIIINGDYESGAIGSYTFGGPCETLGDGQGAGSVEADYNLFLIWGDRVLSESELKSLNDNPWQIFKPKRQHIIISREHLLQIDTQFNDTKPEGESQIDWNNPLTEGLSVFMYPISDERVYEAVFGDIYQMGELKPVGTETWRLEPTRWGMGIRAGGSYSLGLTGPRFIFKNNNRFSQGQNPALCLATWQRTIYPPIAGNTTSFALWHPSYQFSNIYIQSKQFGCQTTFQVGSSANSANIEDTNPGTIDNIPTAGPREDTFIWGQRIPGASANTAKITKTRINYTDSSEWIIRYADQLNSSDWTNETYSINDFTRASIAQSDNNIVACVAMWNRNLTEEELITLGDNPWQILKRKIFIPTNYEPYLMPIRIPRGGRPE